LISLVPKGVPPLVRGQVDGLALLVTDIASFYPPAQGFAVGTAVARPVSVIAVVVRGKQ
jgi:hypothetical protein